MVQLRFVIFADLLLSFPLLGQDSPSFEQVLKALSLQIPELIQFGEVLRYLNQWLLDLDELGGDELLLQLLGVDTGESAVGCAWLPVCELGLLLLVHVLESYILDWIQDPPLAVERRIIRQVHLIAELACIRYLPFVNVALASHFNRRHLRLGL